MLTDVCMLHDKDVTSLPCVLTDVWALQDKDVTALLSVLTDVWALLDKNVTELSCVLTGSRVLQQHPRGPMLFWTVQCFRRSQVPMRHLSGQDAAGHLQCLFCHRGRGPLFQLNRGRDEWFCCCSNDCTRHFLNWHDTYMVVKVVHRSRSNNHCNWSDTLLSVLLSKLC